MALDPVCMMEVDEKSTKNVSGYKGKNTISAPHSVKKSLKKTLKSTQRNNSLTFTLL